MTAPAAPTEKHRETAEQVLDLVLCPTAPGEDPRAEGIKEIAQALANAERDGMETIRRRVHKAVLDAGNKASGSSEYDLGVVTGAGKIFIAAFREKDQ